MIARALSSCLDRVRGTGVFHLGVGQKRRGQGNRTGVAGHSAAPIARADERYDGNKDRMSPKDEKLPDMLFSNMRAYSAGFMIAHW